VTGTRWRILVWGGATFLLLLPLVAMQFTDEVVWDLADFVIFGALLGVALGGYELAMKLTVRAAYRTAAGLAIAAAFFLIWLNLAVGIFGPG